MPNRSTLKQEAKEINRTARVNAYSFSLLFFVITFAIQAIRSYVDRGTVLLNLEKVGAMLPDAFPAVDLTALTHRLGEILSSIQAAVPTQTLPPAVITFVMVMAWLLNCLLSAGYILYIMGIRQGREMGFGTLFDGFAFAGKIILLELWRTFIIAVWSLVFIIPGIIAFYRYSFALYDLLDHPEMGVLDAMALSKKQTRGYRWELFVLDLSFLGWDLLMPLTAGILLIYVKPYREQSWMGYYRAITGTKPDAGDAPQEEENYRYHRLDD